MSHEKNKRLDLAWMLVSLTIILVLSQFAYLAIFQHVSEMMDSLSEASILSAIFDARIFVPILSFLLLEVMAYAFVTVYVWFVAVSVSELLCLSKLSAYFFGILYWLLVQSLIYISNAYFYPTSFFARVSPFSMQTNYILMLIGFYIVWVTSLLALMDCFVSAKRLRWGVVFASAALIFMSASFYFAVMGSHQRTAHSKPNIIIIGIDSLRPDKTAYFGGQAEMPTINQFMQQAMVFSNAYTPLARTFPSWVSVLTGQYPLHSHARANLVDGKVIASASNLAKRLKAEGYLTIYGTDEVRFTDITPQYGFDRLFGPKTGSAEFILGEFADFPLSNLLLQSTLGQYLLPYVYGNRAANVTYQPNHFIDLVKRSLLAREDKPVFLSVHLCLTHWPFRWAKDSQAEKASLDARYQSAIKAVDKQFNDLLALLRAEGLLEHSLVFLISDHGVTLGERGARLIDASKYQGAAKLKRNVLSMKIDGAPAFTTDFARDYALDVSYGQGTDILSLKQYRVLLAVRGFGVPIPKKRVDDLVSLIDIAPTVLDYQQLSPLEKADGVSFAKYFTNKTYPPSVRPFYMETGDRIAEIEKSDIETHAVVASSANAYRVDKDDGLLVLTPAAYQSIINNKQRAIIMGDWMLARYPGGYSQHLKREGKTGKFKFESVYTPPCFILVNMRTGGWTVGFASPLAKSAPVGELMRRFRAFYGKEVS